MKFLTLITLCCYLISCSQKRLTPSRPTSSSSVDESRRQLDFYYQPGRYREYFLPLLPTWANFSVIGQCRWQGATQFFHINRMITKTKLNLAQALQFQLSYNIEIRKRLKETKASFLNAKEQEILYEGLQKRVLGGVTSFKPPEFKQVHLIWLDSYLVNLEGEERLKSLLDSALMGKGHPVFLSYCRNYDEINELKTKLGLTNIDIRVMSAELLTPFDIDQLGSSYQDSSYYRFYLTPFFKQHQKLKFFSFNNQLPPTLRGEVQLQRGKP